MAEYEQFQRTVTINADIPEVDMKTLSVAASWQDDTGATGTITLSTIIVS